jgi:DNA-binding XRE family transcriptional regulator
MTPAEFRCAREYLGLAPEWLARHLGMSARAINQWEQPTGPNPSVAASKFLAHMLDQAELLVGKLTVQAEGNTLPVPFNAQSRNGFPPSYWRAIGSRVAERTRATLYYGDLEGLAREITAPTSKAK